MSHIPLYSPKYNFIYTPIPKVACKSIKAWLLMLEQESFDDFDSTDNNQMDSVNALFEAYQNHHMDKSNDFSLHGTVKKIYGYNQSYLNKDTFSFVIVRNPFKRVLSSFLEKFYNPYYNYRAAEMIENFAKSNPLYNQTPSNFTKDGKISFDGFINVLYDEYLANSFNNGIIFDPHWLPQTQFLKVFTPDQFKIDYIGKLETLHDSFSFLQEKIKFPILPTYNIDDPRYKKYSKTFPSYKEFYKNPETLTKVSQIYSEDIKQYNYSYDG